MCRKRDDYEELRKVINVCCLQVKQGGHGSRMLGMEKRYKFWRAGNGDGVGGVEVMMKETA